MYLLVGISAAVNGGKKTAVVVRGHAREIESGSPLGMPPPTSFTHPSSIIMAPQYDISTRTKLLDRHALYNDKSI